MESAPIPAPIYMASMSASVPPPPPPPPSPAALQAANYAKQRQEDRRFGYKIKVAAIIVAAAVVLSSHPFYNAVNNLWLAFNMTASPCSNEYGCRTVKGTVVGAGLLFALVMYLIGGL